MLWSQPATQTHAVTCNDFCSLTFNFHLYSRGQIGSDGFNMNAFKDELASYSNDERWQPMLAILYCARASPASLSPQQQGIYMHTCVTWSLLAACEATRGIDTGTLADTEKLRRARFLSEDCPLSPSSLLDAFGLVTKRTWADCSVGLYTGDNPTLLLKAAVGRIVCLLQDFVNQSNMVDFQALINATEDADTDGLSASTDLLIRLVDECAGMERNGTHHYVAMSPEVFASCWAKLGVPRCAKHEAAKLASSFPESCVLRSGGKHALDGPRSADRIMQGKAARLRCEGEWRGC